MVFASVLSYSITFLSGNVRPFFKVYNVGMNCAVPFSCLFRDLPKGKDVVTTSCPFAEANSLFMNGVLQSRGYALLYELTAYFACFMWESKVLPLKSLQSSKSPFYASFTIKSVSRKSRFRGKSSEGKILQIPLIQRSCRLLQAICLSHLYDGHLGFLDWLQFGVYVDVLSGFGYWNRI